MYQLRSPESSNMSVCLFTDFDSETVVPQDQRSTVFSSNSTALNMKVTGSKSNGALHWSTSADFRCADTFNQSFYSSSGECRRGACASWVSSLQETCFGWGSLRPADLNAAGIGGLSLTNCQQSPLPSCY